MAMPAQRQGKTICCFCCIKRLFRGNVADGLLEESTAEIEDVPVEGIGKVWVGQYGVVKQEVLGAGRARLEAEGRETQPVQQEWLGEEAGQQAAVEECEETPVKQVRRGEAGVGRGDPSQPAPGVQVLQDKVHLPSLRALPSPPAPPPVASGVQDRSSLPSLHVLPSPPAPPPAASGVQDRSSLPSLHVLPSPPAPQPAASEVQDRSSLPPLRASPAPPLTTGSRLGGAGGEELPSSGGLGATIRASPPGRHRGRGCGGSDGWEVPGSKSRKRHSKQRRQQAAVKVQQGGQQDDQQAASCHQEVPGWSSCARGRSLRRTTQKDEPGRWVVYESWLEESVVRQLHVPPRMRHRVIGVGGAVLRKLQRQCPDVRVHVPPRHDVLTDTVTVKGPRSQVEAALQSLNANLQSAAWH